MSNDWIEWHWTPEKPYPETLDTEVFVMYRDGTGMDSRHLPVRFWHSEEMSDSSWHNPGIEPAEITHYKLSEGN